MYAMSLDRFRDYYVLGFYFDKTDYTLIQFSSAEEMHEQLIRFICRLCKDLGIPSTPSEALSSFVDYMLLQPGMPKDYEPLRVTDIDLIRNIPELQRSPARDLWYPSFDETPPDRRVLETVFACMNVLHNRVADTTHHF